MKCWNSGFWCCVCLTLPITIMCGKSRGSHPTGTSVRPSWEIWLFAWTHSPHTTLNRQNLTTTCKPWSAWTNTIYISPLKKFLCPISIIQFLNSLSAESTFQGRCICYYCYRYIPQVQSNKSLEVVKITQ